MRNRWNDLPLRWRLTVLYVGLLVILLVALGSFLYLDTRSFLISSTALRLEALANTSISHQAPPPRPQPAPPSATTPVTPTQSLETPPFHRVAGNLTRELSWQDTTAVVFDDTGTRVADGSDLTGVTALPVPDSASLNRALTGVPVTYNATVSGQDMLAVLIPVHYPRVDSPVAGVVQMSTPMSLIDSVLGRQRVLIVVGVLVVLLLASAGGLWLTETALKPLQVMIAVCRRIAGGDLSQRVNLPQRRDETGQLASAFDEMVARLDDAFTTQRQFVADASHELRTPLTALSGSLEVLLLAPEGDPETTRRVLHNMRREVQRLGRLVTDLLTLTRLDAHRPLKRQPVDLAALAGEVVESVRPIARSRTLAVESEGDVKMSGDADQLKQVFYNLIGNAIQATDAERGSIVLRMQGEADAVCVTISDNGAGIPESAQAHIFERFYRVDRARARASGGSGLGLAIVKAIVEGHGGRIEPVSSTVGQGTLIRVVLPRAR